MGRGRKKGDPVEIKVKNPFSFRIHQYLVDEIEDQKKVAPEGYTYADIFEGAFYAQYVLETGKKVTRKEWKNSLKNKAKERRCNEKL